MSGYVSIIKSALVAFPFVALLLSLPIFAIQYRKNGSFVFWRGVVIYSFIFYLLAAYFLIILPLPDVATVAKLTTPKYNLEPFTFIAEFVKYSPFVLTQPSTYKATLLSPQFIQPAFNLLLTLPFGVYLRYYFKRSWRQVLLFGFCLSLFFELTQLSGLYGIYPRPYRLFDVDDLFLNTLGSMLGFWLAPVVSWMFPAEDKIKRREQKAQAKVSLMRRAIAFLMDFVILFVFSTFMESILTRFNLVGDYFVGLAGYLLSFLILYVLIPVLLNGQTVGKWIVRIRLVDIDRSPISFWRLVFRQGLLYLLIVPWVFIWTPFWLAQTGVVANADLGKTYFIAVGMSIVSILYFLHIFIQLFRRDSRLIYEIISQTREIAVIKEKKNHGK